MQLRRNEILTGLLVLVTVAVLTGVLILLGAPGLFRPLITYRLYFDNAAGIKLGAPVLLAGRKIGQVESLFSPVTKEESARAQQSDEAIRPPEGAPSPTPANGKPKYEVRIDVRVDKTAVVYRDAKARLMSLGLLGETAIDFTSGNDSAGRAKDGDTFAGERVPDFGESISKVIVILEPVATAATATIKELQNTAQNLNHITDENSQLNLALGQFRTFAEHLTTITAPDSSLTQSLKHIQEVSAQLTKDNNIAVTLQNFRNSSEQLKSALNDIAPDLKTTGANLKDLTQTVKTQPWRLIYPTTKKYPNEQPENGEAITVRKNTKAAPAASPSPASRRR